LGDINLYPDYAKPHQMGEETYDEYVRLFLKTVDVDVLCMDHYPIFKPDKDTRHRYCNNLETMRKFSLRKGIAFWNYFNSMPHGALTDPTEAQIRWQVYTSIAYGAKGVNYFTYGTPKTFEFPKGSSILRHWHQCQTHQWRDQEPRANSDAIDQYRHVPGRAEGMTRPRCSRVAPSRTSRQRQWTRCPIT